jgi:hypothetical protein
MFQFNLLENQQRNLTDAGMVRPSRSDLKDPPATHHTRPVFRTSYLEIFSRMIQAHGSKSGTVKFLPDPSALSSVQTHYVPDPVPIPAPGAKTTPPTHPPPTGSSSGSASLAARTPARATRSLPSCPPLACPVGAQVCQLERPPVRHVPCRPAPHWLVQWERKFVKLLQSQLTFGPKHL